MTKKLKKLLIRIIVAVVLLAAIIVLDKLYLTPNNFPFWARLLLYLVPYVIAGYDIVLHGVQIIFKGGFLDENFLMTLATVGSFVLGEFSEASFVMLFFQIGEWFQKYAVGKSRKSISELMDIAPETANRVSGDLVETIDPEEIQVNDILLIYPGEKVPVDGVVVEGHSSLNTSALTGESVPVDVFSGSTVYSGSINISAPIKMTAEKAYSDSTVKKILDLIENSTENKSKSENFITKFSRVYTPFVCIGAVLLAVLGFLFSGDWATWIRRALIFLVVSCPCALVVSIPLSFFGGIGSGSRHGVLVKGSSYLEKLNDAKIICFDKTGTLTKGNFAVTKILSFNGFSEDDVLRFATECEAYSTHPIAVSLRECYETKMKEKVTKPTVSLIEEDPGKGIIFRSDNGLILCGNIHLMGDYQIQMPSLSLDPGTVIYVAKDQILAGVLLLQDEIKKEASDTIRDLHKLGFKETVMLTGDNNTIAQYVANQLQLTGYYASLFPEEKVNVFSQIRGSGSAVFVGDGINDAPVLKIADVGIAMGALGSDASIEAADIVLMDDNPYKIVIAKKIAQKTMRIVFENIVFALGVKVITLILSAVGVTGMDLAIFADVGVAVIAILNAMRALYIKDSK